MGQDLATDWRWLDERIAAVSIEIEELAHADDGAVRLMSVPGIGPIISSATVAGIGKGDVFGKGRDFSAWLGLVPKQTSTGGRPILGRISKRGNRYLRQFVRAGGSRRLAQAAKLRALRPQPLDRGGGAAAALQQTRDRARQQARPHRLGRAALWPQIPDAHGERSWPQPTSCWRPCSAPSRRGLDASVQVAGCLPASLDRALRAAPPATCRPGRRNGHPDRTKELDGRQMQVIRR